ncbi:hypothetical protein [Flavonifractor sp. An91]|uniref:hypothetical protein n=1 Tax=Flavonifractor sp. An91 TaxID=1965665 RepID=UPI0013A5FD4F|nr:hypothetical protein [Flavonifractor sp. An91]
MEPKRKEPGGCPPTDEQKIFSVHTALLKGIAVFFVRQAFSFSLGLTHHPAKDNS